MNPTYPITNALVVAHIREIIAHAYGIKRALTHNPCSAPTSLLREHLRQIQDGYVVTEKTDGVRYLLVLGTWQKEAFACMVDRAMKIQQVELNAPSHLFKGTVFDGELVQSFDKTVKFLVFDCIQLDGESLRRQTFTIRYAKLRTYFADDAKQSVDKITCDGILMTTKYFVPAMDVGRIDVKKLSHLSDGFILQPVDGLVVWGRDKRCFKWKYQPSIDVFVSNGRLSCAEGPIDQHCSMFTWSIPEADDGLWECELTVHGSCITLKPTRLRTDKHDANSAATIVGVVKEIKDAVQLWEIAPSI